MRSVSAHGSAGNAQLKTDAFEHAAAWTEVEDFLDLEAFDHRFPILHCFSLIPQERLAHSRIVVFPSGLLHGVAHH